MNLYAKNRTNVSVWSDQADVGEQFRHAPGGTARFSGRLSMVRGVLVAAAILSTGIVAADVSVSIDPVKNCLDTNGGYFPYGALLATPPIAAGTYMVYLRNNTMSCYLGNLAGTLNYDCSINSVLLRGVNSFQAGWGLSVGSPVMVDVATPTVFHAFIIDTPCGDNSGRAILQFKGPL